MQRIVRICGVALTLWAVSAVASTNPSREEKRFSAYKFWTRHYASVLGVDLELRFVKRTHLLYCGWVQQAGPGAAVVGFSSPDKECESVSPRELALHEVCHLRWAHIFPLTPPLSDEQMHFEVRRCMERVKQQERPFNASE
jgi:hypothetical protein